MIDPTTFIGHTVITDPREYAAVFETLPGNLARIPESLAGFLVNYDAYRHPIYAAILEKRGAEVDLRWVAAILQRTIELNPAPLAVARHPTRRVLCTCRDTAVVLCSMLRQRGTPARVRFGFAYSLYEANQANQPPHDHALVEYYRDGHWRYLESRFSASFQERCHRLGVPTDDFPRELFWPAGEAWRRIRSGESSAASYARSSSNPLDGLRRVRDLFYADMASMQGYEPLLWDMLVPWRTPSAALADAPTDARELDELAALAADERAAWLRTHSVRLPPDGDDLMIDGVSPLLGRYRVRAGRFVPTPQPAQKA